MRRQLPVLFVGAVEPGDPDAYTLSLEQVLDKLRERAESTTNGG